MKKLLLLLLIPALLLGSGCTVSKKAEVTGVTYPESAVMQLPHEQLNAFLNRATPSNSYETCAGLDGTSLTLSPYFEASADGKEISAYATLAYSQQLGGQLHSFATVLVKPLSSSGFNISFKLKTSFSVKTAEVLPAADSVKTTQDEVTATFSSYGTYTFLFNDRQSYPFTVYVRQYTDENSEIAAYKEEYGAENVIVYEKGYYDVDKISLPSDSVLYLKSGAFLRAEKTYEITSAEDEAAAADRDAFITIDGKSNVTIKGNGIIDFTAHYLHSRQAFYAAVSSNVTLENVIFLNPSAWTVYVYHSDNIQINNVSVYGYKINSDAFNICNSANVTLTGCFARTGDDCFSAKSLGSWDKKACENVNFLNCYAWAGKARPFGITGEIEAQIKDVLFKGCIVLFRDSNWSQIRLGSLVVIAEAGSGSVENITFEDIIVNNDFSNAITLCVENSALEGFVAKNIAFKNITINQARKSLIRRTNETNSFSGSFENVVINGTLLTSETLDKLFTYDNIEAFSFGSDS